MPIDARDLFNDIHILCIFHWLSNCMSSVRNCYNQSDKRKITPAIGVEFLRAIGLRVQTQQLITQSGYGAPRTMLNDLEIKSKNKKLSYLYLGLQVSNSHPMLTLLTYSLYPDCILFFTGLCIISAN